ncbi:uncharacterized protein FA14DRAFT_181194 [Meira miltonrushii]|uniref:Uncharacterized protein n=1 Tax=Meira miltonrushii TaxID=1280837 RepID=A0A316V4N5_9BASI|nr:uncharacterized protein FA14DRAFT_181194 [Meira miltonrushii]PWN32507.1 hypothetical protein FA14DRAFT_181194 [Meira miltonrushii]
MLFTSALIYFYLTVFFQSANALPAGGDDRPLKLPKILTGWSKSSSTQPDTPKSPSASWEFHHQDRMVHHARVAEESVGKQQDFHNERFHHHQDKLLHMRLDDANEKLAKVEAMSKPLHL